MTAQLALLENHLGLEVPVAPPATDEQLVAPLDGTIEGKYRRWRATDDGRDAYDAIEELALLEAAHGAQRVEVGELMATIRRNGIRRDGVRVRIPLNHNHRSRIARELRAAHPHLRPLIEVRELLAT